MKFSFSKKIVDLITEIIMYYFVNLKENRP